MSGAERLLSRESHTVVWSPQPGPQEHLLSCPTHEILFGGARGCGKTAAIIGHFAVKAGRYGEAAKGIIFRRTFKQLEEALAQMQRVYAPLGAEYHVGSAVWVFPNGATLRLRHLESEKDALNYHGHSYTHIYFDELQNWPTSRCLDLMRATLRSADGVPCQIVATANPGGPGHAWVKRRYVSPAPAGYRVIEDENGLERVYIPGRLTDNKALLENDPTYADRLRQIANPQLVKAWLEGSWDITASGIFEDVWDPSRQVVPPFPLPQAWPLICGFDWGSSRPACLLVFAKITDSAPPGITLPRHFPRGSFVLVDELYTAKRDEDGSPMYNTGQRLTSEELGAAIAHRLRPYGRGRVKQAAADANIFAAVDGPSIYSRMQHGAAQEGFPISFSPAVSGRVAGLQLIRTLLNEAKKDRAEAPGLWITNRCDAWLATVPVIEADSGNPDDVNTDAPDHAYDATRYALFSKPRIARTMKFTY
jgi:hypothetical protein